MRVLVAADPVTEASVEVIVLMERGTPPFVDPLERTLLGVVLAGTMAALLLVAKNNLAPVQTPLTFGLVFWKWFLLFYAAIALPVFLVVWLAARLLRFSSVPRWLLALQAVGFLGAVLLFNARAVGFVFGLEGPGRFRWLCPASFLVCGLGLLALAPVPREKRAALRLLTALSVAFALGALLPSSAGRARADAPPSSARTIGQRFVLVGVDGADWDYLEPLMARGELPHFAALRARGAWGRLKTLRPTRSAVVWTTVVTGKEPRRHGITAFHSWHLRGVQGVLPPLRPLKKLGFTALYVRLEDEDEIFKSPVDSSTRKVPAFWTIASARRSPVNVVNWWATFPAEAILGAIVSERAYHEELAYRGKPHEPHPHRLTYPEGLYEEIADRIVLPDQVTIDDIRPFMDVTPQEFKAMQQKRRFPTRLQSEFPYTLSSHETQRRLALYLIERGRRQFGTPPDLLVLFRLVDNTCHAALTYSELVKNHLDASPEDVRKFGGVVSSAYRAVDRALGDILEAFGEANVLIVSDHGFQLEGEFYGHDRKPDGIFIAGGPAFRRGRVEGLSVYDIMPLMLYLKGLPLADDFDGALPAQAIDPAFLSAHPVLRVASYGGRSGELEAAERRADVDAEMLERLRALGYIK